MDYTSFQLKITVKMIPRLNLKLRKIYYDTFPWILFCATDLLKFMSWKKLKLIEL